MFCTRLKGIFRYKELKFLQILYILLGEEFMEADYQYIVNLDVSSIVFTWALQFRIREEALWVMRAIVKLEWMSGMVQMLAYAEPILFFLWRRRDGD